MHKPRRGTTADLQQKLATACDQDRCSSGSQSKALLGAWVCGFGGLGVAGVGAALAYRLVL